MQRERETELLFRGQQIQQAIESYAAVRPQRSWPPTLEALLEDRRNDPPRHHLRRLYADPFTGFADWRLLRSADGGITGVASRSERPAMRREGVPVVQPDRAAPPAADSRLQARVGDWLFRASGSNAPTTK